MADRRDQEIRLVATDQASKVIDKVADKLDDLDKQGDAAIEITADDKASADIKSVSQRLAGLSDEDKTIVIRAQVADAERDVARILKSLARVDEMDDEEIEIRVDVLGNARQRLDEVQRELRDLDGETAEVRVEAPGVDGVLDKLGGVQGQLGDLAGMLAGGGGAAAGMGALAAGAITLADNLAEASLEAEVLAQLTGDTIEDASRLNAVWKTTGADASDLADVILQMNGVLTDSPELAKQIGVNLGDGSTTGQRFVEVVKLVQAGLIDSTTQSKIFGEEGVRQVARLTSTYDDLGEAIADVSDEQVFTAAERADLERYSQAMTNLKTVAANFAAAIGNQVVPQLTGLAEAILAVKGGVEAIEGLLPDWTSGWASGLGDINRFSGGMDVFRDGIADTAAGLRDLGDFETGDFGGGTFETAAARADGYRRDVEGATRALEGQVAATFDLLAAEEAQASARRASADAGIALRDAQRGFNEQLAESNEALATEGATLEDASKAMDDLSGSAAGVADAQVRLAEEAYTAQGRIISQTDKQSIWNRSMLESARSADGPLREAIVNYIATVNGIPAEKVSEILANPDYATLDAATAALDAVVAERDAEMRAQATNVGPTEEELNRLARERNARIVVQTEVRGVGMIDAGGTVGPEGGLAAEIGPEFAQLPSGRRVLLTRPSLVPPGTRVTSRRETARQLRLRRYDAGTGITVSAGGTTVIHEHVTINSAVIGNRFDVDRTVAQALRRYERRNGRRRP